MIYLIIYIVGFLLTPLILAKFFRSEMNEWTDPAFVLFSIVWPLVFIFLILLIIVSFLRTIGEEH